jgi:uncharacterized protein involved in exopolysaccharide biosynthesis
MDDVQGGGPSQQPPSEDISWGANITESEIDRKGFPGVVVKRRKPIICIFLISIITASMVSLLFPKLYKTSATIISA